MATLSSDPGRDWDRYIDDCEREHERLLAEGLIPCDGDCGEYLREDQLKTIDGDHFCIERCYAHERRRLAKKRLERMRAGKAARRPMTGAEAARHIEGFLTLVNTSLARVYRAEDAR